MHGILYKIKTMINNGYVSIKKNEKRKKYK